MTLRLNQLEQELRDGELSPHSEQWLAASQLTADQLLPLLKPLPEVVVPTVHLYYCDHLGTPLALLNQQGEADWRAEFDPWGNQVDGRNPKKLYQPIRMQGQHYDEETGLHYNRHRYYDPMLGRYITQDPIGLKGGWNIYQYTTNPLQQVDPLGLADDWGSLGDGGLGAYCQQNNSANMYLPPDEAQVVMRNNEKMHNVYNPMSEYVFGFTVGSAVAGMTAINSTASLAEKSAACVEGIAKSMIVEGEKNPKKLSLSCAKSFTNKGSTKLQG